MADSVRALFGAIFFAASLPVMGLSTDIPATGLPSASDYAGSLLPDIKGVVSWQILAQVEPVQQGGKMVPQFSRDILGLDHRQIRVQGFMIPLDMGDRQKRFLLSAVPPHCPFCLPAGPDAIVEVLAKQPIAYGFDPIVVAGKFAVLKDDPAGVLYRMTDAEPIAAASK